ncbi:helix-turn-helix domain-containing protein [Natrinema gari]|uniref:HTH cro/C1-type domain-containing protein n=1 Tax=Natrinema gari JCM 14663 TaxID=1230459 RepID=L9ZG98_9EURY|nr:helix-turn-helix domain-containing protein [Natrinema gari]ELY85056.1 hypothetical protein C486_00320 [Natrinema gari JCM 14663]
MSADADAGGEDLLGQSVDEAFIERMREKLLATARRAGTDGDDLVELTDEFQTEAGTLAYAYDGVDRDALEAEILDTFDEAIVLQKETAKDVDDRTLAERVQDRVDEFIARVLGRGVGESGDADGRDDGRVGAMEDEESSGPEPESETVGSPIADEASAPPAADPDAEDVVGRSDEDRIAAELRALRDHRIAALYEQTGLTQREVAESFDVTPATVSRAVNQHADRDLERDASGPEEPDADIAGALPEGDRGEDRDPDPECFHCGGSVTREGIDEETPICADCDAIGITPGLARAADEIMDDPEGELNRRVQRLIQAGAFDEAEGTP